MTTVPLAACSVTGNTELEAGVAVAAGVFVAPPQADNKSVARTEEPRPLLMPDTLTRLPTPPRWSVPAA